MEKLRKKSDRGKKNVAIGTAVFVVLLVFASWASFLYLDVFVADSQRQQASTFSPFANLKSAFSNLIYGDHSEKAEDQAEDSFFDSYGTEEGEASPWDQGSREEREDLSELPETDDEMGSQSAEEETTFTEPEVSDTGGSEESLQREEEDQSPDRSGEDATWFGNLRLSGSE